MKPRGRDKQTSHRDADGDSALRESHERCQLAMEVLAGFVFDWDTRTDRIEYFGDTGRIVGFAVDEIPREGAWWRGRMHPDDAPGYGLTRKAILSVAGSSWSLVYRFRHKDSHYLDLATKGHIIRDENGRILRIVGGVSDISERMHAERERSAGENALRKSDERFRLASETLAAFVYDWDSATDHTDWFGALEAVIGFRADEAPPDSAWWQGRIHPDDLPAAFEHATAAIRDGDARYHIEYRILHRDGHYVALAEAARIVRDRNGRLLRIVGGMRDISKRRHLEHERTESLQREQLARAAAENAAHARDEVLGVVSHDLRNSLRAIEVCASALLAGTEARSETTEKLLQVIQHSAESTDRIVRDLLDVASIEGGRLGLDARAEAPEAILAQVAGVFTPAARARGIVLESHSSPDLPAVHADAGRLFQALSNLVTNALNFTRAGGFVTLSAVLEADGVRFIVADTGIGIDSSDLAHVFEHYWQKSHVARRGVGLGLAIVQGIVTAHGGDISVKSTPGKGSQFSFTIPMERRKEAHLVQ